MNSLSDEYNNALTSGNTGYADYLGEIMHTGQQQYGTQFNQWTGANPQGISAPPPLSTTMDQFKGVLRGGYDMLFGAGSGATIESGVGGVKSGVATVGSGIAFLTDIPRVATTFIGAILIIGGIIALATNKETIIELVKPK